MSCAPAPTSTCCWTRTPAPPRRPPTAPPTPATPRAPAGRSGGRRERRARRERRERRRGGGDAETAVRGPAGQARRIRPAPQTPPGAGVRPSGFVGRLHLTVPLVTLLGLADRPGEIPGLGPVDPWLARDLARAAAANPKTTWCLSVTDGQGHVHRPRLRPGSTRKPEQTAGRAAPAPGAGRPRPAGPPDPPAATSRDSPGFTSAFTSAFAFGAAGRDGPPGGYGCLAVRHRGSRAARPGLRAGPGRHRGL